MWRWCLLPGIPRKLLFNGFRIIRDVRVYVYENLLWDELNRWISYHRPCLPFIISFEGLGETLKRIVELAPGNTLPAKNPTRDVNGRDDRDRQTGGDMNYDRVATALASRSWMSLANLEHFRSIVTSGQLSIDRKSALFFYFKQNRQANTISLASDKEYELPMI